MEELLSILLKLQEVSSEESTKETIVRYINELITQLSKGLDISFNNVVDKIENVNYIVQNINDRVNDMYYLIIGLCVIIAIMFFEQMYLVNKIKRIESLLLESQKKEEREREW